MRRGIGGLVLAVALAAPATAQQPAQSEGARLVASEVSLSRSDAVLRVELSDGRELTWALRDGQALIDGNAVGAAARGSALDASWRELLNQAMETPAESLPALLTGWEAPVEQGAATGTALDRSLEDVFAGVQAAPAADAAAADVPVPPAPPMAPGAPGFSDDSVSRLVERITVLQSQIEELEGAAARGYVRNDNAFSRFFGHIGRGIAGILSVLVTYAVLFGIGFATIVLGGRRFIEGVGDTARHATVRSGLVGLAASFLVVPAFVLGIIALVISIIGIPALLVFVPLFPLAVVLAVLLGYLGVAHAAGEAFAERRFSGEEWYRMGNSYYFLLAGLGLLLALFLGAHILELTGPLLGFLQGILMFLGVVLTWAVATIGLGAVLISRAGTRPISSNPFDASEPSLEETHV
jgi:hypothetical protein